MFILYPGTPSTKSTNNLNNHPLQSLKPVYVQIIPRAQCFDERPPCISRQRTVIQRIENTTDPLSRPRRCWTPQSTDMVAGSPGGRDPTQLSRHAISPSLV
ncbi:hypothetical protein VTJ04DRAFT_8356 [Mycothermus thermophilus]|uniref:uncharacterized protein n=1 Tax=Humicola insolens TaxID=85995 RepID=UPI0037428E49